MGDVSDGERLKLYRGGVTLPVRGPAWFTSSRSFAGTYGPVGEYELYLDRCKGVSLKEWQENYTDLYVRLDPIRAARLVSGGYTSALTRVNKHLFVFLPSIEKVKVTAL